MIGEEAGKNVSSIPQVSKARDRRTNNPSAVILLVNPRSWYEHPQGLSVHYSATQLILAEPIFLSRVEGRGSRVEDSMWRVEGTMSRVIFFPIFL